MVRSCFSKKIRKKRPASTREEKSIKNNNKKFNYITNMGKFSSNKLFNLTLILLIGTLLTSTGSYR